MWGTMTLVRETELEHSRSKVAILDLLANKLNCERTEVDFLFGRDSASFNSNTVMIPDVRSH